MTTHKRPPRSRTVIRIIQHRHGTAVERTYRTPPDWIFDRPYREIIADPEVQSAMLYYRLARDPYIPRSSHFLAWIQGQKIPIPTHGTTLSTPRQMPYYIPRIEDGRKIREAVAEAGLLSPSLRWHRIHRLLHYRQEIIDGQGLFGLKATYNVPGLNVHFERVFVSQAALYASHNDIQLIGPDIPILRFDPSLREHYPHYASEYRSRSPDWIQVAARPIRCDAADPDGNLLGEPIHTRILTYSTLSDLVDRLPLEPRPKSKRGFSRGYQRIGTILIDTRYPNPNPYLVRPKTVDSVPVRDPTSLPGTFHR